jgi:hypothetical protein
MRLVRRTALLLAPLVIATRMSPPAASAAQSLLYMTPAEWKAASSQIKMNFTQEFMRVYCGDPRMSYDRFIDCLDAASGGMTTFEQALTCSSRVLQDEQSGPVTPRGPS